MRRTKNDANRFVYRYWVKPKGEVPRELWETARKMQQFSNVLVQLREDAGFNAETLPEDREQSSSVSGTCSLAGMPNLNNGAATSRTDPRTQLGSSRCGL